MRFLLILTGIALVAALVQAVTGCSELTFYLTPLFLIGALLLAGHYVAEDAIVRAWRAHRPRSTRAPGTRRLAHRERPLTSLLARSPLCRRGPPARVTFAL